MNQSTFEFIEIAAMDRSVDDFIYPRFETRELKCENILVAKLASLPGEIKYKTLLRCSGDQRLEMY